jgi:transcriptional regulator with XRE-family HTH domain
VDQIGDRMKELFDNKAFFSALDAQRVAKRMNWKQVAAATGVGASTLTRLAQGKRPDIDGLAALLRWSGLKAESFIAQAGAEAAAEPIAQMAALLWSDPALSDDHKATLESVLLATYNGLRNSTNN